MLVIQISLGFAGNEATNAESSNFFGQLAGNQAVILSIKLW
jgi:hypothetical protein